MREERFDLVVVGGGPAGLAAAASGAESGVSVAIIDDNPAPGGQIWRNEAGAPPKTEVAEWLERLDRDRVRRFDGMTVVDAEGPDALIGLGAGGPIRIHAEHLVLATGATELLLPFPGWTLPNVFGAGGLQALVKSGWDVTGKSIVVAGSGPLLLAVAAYLKQRGAAIRCIVEQASKTSVLAFGASLVTRPGKLVQGLGLRQSLAGIPQHHSSWIIRAEGSDRVEAVVVRTPTREIRVECDLVACGFGLVPQTTLGRYLGCATVGDALDVDRLQQTTVDRVWAAGEVTGIGGVDAAVVEGRIAGYAAVGMNQRARDLTSARDRERAFARRLARTFALRDELRSLATGETIVCRCEDVPIERVRGHRTVRDAKLKTRCGMGPCQGRVCGPALTFIEGWPRDRVRPPLYPVSVEVMAGIGGTIADDR